jgi:quercetin dioxygenase-like cupin family protein
MIHVLLLEKKNLYHYTMHEKQLGEEQKYQGKFTTDDVDIREIVDVNTSQEHEVYYVTFKKGCRTRPHIHASDQTLVVIKGKGIVVIVNKIDINNDGKTATINAQLEGESSSVIELHEGDVVSVPAGKLHWHGALDDDNSNEAHLFSHIAIRNRTDRETIWF